MIRTVAVTTSAKLVPGSNPNGFGDDVTIFNTGSATAYLDSDQPDTTTAGLPLTAGSSCLWAKDQALWVIAPAATTLTVSDNSGAVFDAGAIASQILSQGLAAQIAAAINVAGVPAIDSGDVLANFSAFAASNTAPSYSGQSIFCSRYQSLRMYFSETYAIGVPLLPRIIQITWYADAALTIPVGFDSFNIPTGTNAGLVPAASAIVSMPCRGPYCTLGAQSVPGDSTATVVVIGSYRAAQDLKWTKLTDGFTGSSGFVTVGATGAQGGVFSMSGSLPVGTTLDYPILPGGSATVSAATGATTGICEFVLRDTNNNRYIYRRLFPVSAGTQVFTDNITLPNSPVVAQGVIVGGATAVQFSVIAVDRA